MAEMWGGGLELPCPRRELHSPHVSSVSQAQSSPDPVLLGFYGDLITETS